MGGSKKRSLDLEVSAVEEEPGRRKTAAVVSKSSKKAKNEAENDDLQAEQTPKGKKKNKRKRQSDRAEAEPPENAISRKDAGKGILVDKDGSKEGKKKMDEEEQESESVEIELGSDLDDVPFSNASNAVQNELSVGQNSASLEVGNSNHRPVRPELHMDVFKNLSSADSRVREAASQTLVQELQAVQQDYESRGMRDSDGEGLQLLEAAKDEGLKACAPTLRYALRRLIRGVSSSRPYARQGFAVGFATVVRTIPCIELKALVKLIEELLEVTSSMNGQEARDVLLGRLFAYGALVRSGRITSISDPNKDAILVKHVTQYLLTLAEKKNFMRESAIAIILDLVYRAGNPKGEKTQETPAVKGFKGGGQEESCPLLLASVKNLWEPPWAQIAILQSSNTCNLQKIYKEVNLQQERPDIHFQYLKGKIDKTIEK